MHHVKMVVQLFFLGSSQVALPHSLPLPRRETLQQNSPLSTVSPATVDLTLKVYTLIIITMMSGTSINMQEALQKSCLEAVASLFFILFDFFCASDGVCSQSVGELAEPGEKRPGHHLLLTHHLLRIFVLILLSVHAADPRGLSHPQHIAFR